MPDQEESSMSLQAISLPANQENPQPVAEQPRQPTNLQGLLRFATEVTRNEDAPGPSLPMDEERRKFLEDAISSLTVDVTAEMQTCIAILSDHNIISDINCDSDVPEDVLQAFESLMDIVINLDMSIGFYKLGGYKIFPVCLSCEHIDVRSQACQLLAEISQNNPFCQSRALDSGFIHLVLNILKGEESTKVLRSALYAASCLVREHDECAKAFLAEGGCDALIRSLGKPCITLRNKAAFILCHIYPRHPELKDKALALVDVLAVALREMVDDNPGLLLNALRLIVSSSHDEEVISRFNSPSLDLQGTVTRHMRFCRADYTTYPEEYAYCNDILKILTTNNKSVTNISDESDIER